MPLDPIPFCLGNPFYPSKKTSKPVPTTYPVKGRSAAVVLMQTICFPDIITTVK
jgi:hypothetical protein